MRREVERRRFDGGGRGASTTASALVVAAAGVLLILSPSSLPFADAFSSSSTSISSSPSLLPLRLPSTIAGTGTMAGSPRISWRDCRRITVVASASPDDIEIDVVVEEEEEGDAEDDELETESSTTGLFIPGFSDKFAPTPSPLPPPAPPVVVVQPRMEGKKEVVKKAEERDKDEGESKRRKVSLPEEVSRSVIDLPSLPKLSLPSLFSEKKKKPVPPSKPPPPKSRGTIEESIASALGGLILGTGVGLYVDVATDVLYDTDLPGYVPPLAIGFALGIGSYLCAGLPGNNLFGSAVRAVLGGPILGFKDGIVNSINRKVDEIKATPGKIVDAVERKIDETVDEIKATPGKIKDAAVEKIDDTVDEIRAIPGKITDAVEKKIDETVEEIRATPGRIADTVENAIEDAVDEIKTTFEDAVEDVTDAVESVVALPGKKLEEIGLLSPRADGDVVAPIKKPAPPVEKSTPPPPTPVVKQKSFLPPADQKLDLPSFALPKVSIPELPKVGVPELTKSAATSTPPKAAVPTKKEDRKVEAPKLSLPKVSIPELPKVSIPERPKSGASLPPTKVVVATTTKKEEKKKDNYVFTEAALKEFIAKDKPAVTELDRQRVEERKVRELRDDQIRRAANAATAAFKGGAAAAPGTTEAKSTMTTKTAAVPKEKTPVASVPPVKGRPTFSLFGLGGGSPETTSIPDAAATSNAPPKATAVAPRGIPTISKWKIDPKDNSISGLISGSGSFRDGEPVTTSPIAGEVASNTVVRTKSGSRYFLGEEDVSTNSGIFSFFGSGGAPVSTSNESLLSSSSTNKGADIAAEKAKKANEVAAERKRKAEAAAAASKKAAEEAAATKREAQAKSLREAEEKRRIAAEAAAKREALAQAQKEAQKQASDEAMRQREAREEERRLNADKRKQVEFDRYQRQLEIDRQKQQKAIAPKEEVQSTPISSVPRPTFSLFGLGEPKEDLDAPKPVVSSLPAKKTVPAPRGVPKIKEWTLNSDSTISGFISGSSSFDDGAPVTTSPIVGLAASRSVVQTKSGSKYFLEEEKLSGGGFFSLFSTKQNVALAAPEVKLTPENKRDVATEAAKDAQRNAQAKANQAAEEKRRAAEEAAAKREAQVLAQKQADTKKQAAAAAAQQKKVEQEKEKARREAEDERKLAIAAQKKAEQDQKKREMEEKKRVELEKAANERRKQQAEQAVSKAPRGVTISLFGFGGEKSESSSDAPFTVSTKSTSTAPPRGIPVISKWKQSRDGSITGVITGSAAFNDGDPVTTSPIKGTAAGGTVVTTTSGSRYYLVGGSATTSASAAKSRSAAAAAAAEKAVAAKKVADEKAAAAAASREKATAIAADKAAAAKKVLDEKAAAAAASREKAAAIAAEKAAAAKTAANKKAAKAEALARQKEASEKAKQAVKTVATVTRSPTISLFGLRGSEEPASVPAPPRGQQKLAKPSAPNGVPTISGWKLNRDGSISGRISGSSNFREGEQVTTSPIAQGRIESGSTVRTGSGSSYFLG